MITAIAFVAAAACGALARADATGRANRPGFPWGTLAVNVSGAFALGALHGAGTTTLTVVGTAGLGAYTTFSGFAADIAALAERHLPLRAAGYVAVTVVAGIAAAALGRLLA